MEARQNVWPTLYLHYLYFELWSKHPCQKHERDAPGSRCTERSVKDCAFLSLRCPAGPLRTRYKHMQGANLWIIKIHKEQMKNACKSSLQLVHWGGHLHAICRASVGPPIWSKQPISGSEEFRGAHVTHISWWQWILIWLIVGAVKEGCPHWNLREMSGVFLQRLSWRCLQTGLIFDHPSRHGPLLRRCSLLCINHFRIFRVRCRLGCWIPRVRSATCICHCHTRRLCPNTGTDGPPCLCHCCIRSTIS